MARWIAFSSCFTAPHRHEGGIRAVYYVFFLTALLFVRVVLAQSLGRTFCSDHSCICDIVPQSGRMAPLRQRVTVARLTFSCEAAASSVISRLFM